MEKNKQIDPPAFSRLLPDQATRNYFDNQNFQYVRKFSYYLGGILISLFEQGLLIGKHGSILNRMEQSLQEIRNISQIIYVSNFVSSLKNVMKSNPRSLWLQDLQSELQNQINFIIGAEQFIKQILLHSQKFQKEQAYLAVNPSQYSSQLLFENEAILQFISDQFKVDIQLISIKNQFQNTFQSKEPSIFSLILYQLPTHLYACYQQNINTPLYSNGISSLGYQRSEQKNEFHQQDSKLLSQSAYYNNQQDRNLHSSNSSIAVNQLPNYNISQGAQYNLHSSNNSIAVDQLPNYKRNNTEMISCNKCNKYFERNELFLNETCQHSFCIECIQSCKFFNFRLPNQLCLLYQCKHNLPSDEIHKFLESQKKQNHQPPSHQTNSPLASNDNLYKKYETKENCVRCGTQISNYEGFKNSPVCHIYCFDCIHSIYNQSFSSSSLMTCITCKKVLCEDRIKDYLNYSKQTKNDKKSQIDQQPLIQSQYPSTHSLHHSSSPSKYQMNQLLDQKSTKNNLKEQLKCSKCETSMESKQQMMYHANCDYATCYKCVENWDKILQNINLKERYISCPKCKHRTNINNVESFLTEARQQTNPNLIKPKDLSSFSHSSSATNNENNNSNNNKTVSSMKTYGRINCSLCSYYSYLAKEFYCLQQCNHKFCLNCINMNLYQQETCFVFKCPTQLNKEEIIQFLFQEPSKNTQSYSVKCAKCKKEDSIFAQSAPEYFKCLQCSQSKINIKSFSHYLTFLLFQYHIATCIRHQDLISICKCFCDKCGSQTKNEDNRLICQKCKIQICTVCKRENCSCPCTYCKKMKTNILCDCITKTCSICLDEYEDIKLNNQQQTLLRKQANCSHYFCNSCNFYQQSIKYGQTPFKCLFCE